MDIETIVSSRKITLEQKGAQEVLESVEKSILNKKLN